MLRNIVIALTISTLLLTGCPRESFSIPLQAGLNADVVYPGKTMKVEDAVASILPQLEGGSVAYWNGSTWQVWTPGPAFDDLFILEHGKTYTITLTSSATWVGR